MTAPEHRPPDSHDDPYRLPTHVVPTRYELRLDPDLTAFRFDGAARITLEVRQPTREIVLNAAELDVREAVVSAAGRTVVGTVELEEAAERCRVRLAEPIDVGKWTLTLRFTGILNDKLRGFYRSRYLDAGGQPVYLAATQFEATDARRAFPCWDEPAFKAVFRVALAIDASLTAVSNTAIESERLEGRKKIVQFRDTIRMSTYLVAFIVGRLEATEPLKIGETDLRIWSVPGKRGLTRFGLAIGAASLKFFQQYYGLPYPGDKLDLLAIPDFASGAMENLGAITFRETALLVDEAQATHAELERVADVVAHENAHMWFGDLVTMSWWNGLWLNEAFATFMEMLAVHAWKPEWDRWTTFGVSRAAAMTVDGLHSTRPIEYPVQAPKDAEAMFDVLTYEKGASVLRMLEQYLGPEVFRDGVRRYLRAHAYANADTGDLWTALGEASREPVPALMDGWIFHPGYPLVTATLDRGASPPALQLSQQRFTYLPADSPGGRWHIPVRYRVDSGSPAVQRTLLTEATVRVPLADPEAAVVINEGGHGFYRVRYGGELRERIERLLAVGRLSAIERFNLLSDAWAAAVAGVTPLREYLALTARFEAERDKNVWSVLLGSFDTLYRLVDPMLQPRLAAFIRGRLQPAWQALGWAPKKGEDELTRQLRGDLLRTLGSIGGDRAVGQEAAARFRHPEVLDPNVLPAVIAILAYTGDAARYDEFVARYRGAATPQEERRFLYSLAAFRLPALVERTLQSAVNGDIRTQDAPFIIRLVLMNPEGREAAWAFVKREWDAMAKLFPKSGLRRMCEGVIGLATPDLERDVRRFFAERKIDLGGRTLDQYLEQLRIAVALREREAAGLAADLPPA